MKTIGIALEYGLYPIWLHDERGFIVDNILAEELGFDDEFSSKVQKLQDLYDSLFIDTEIEFSYIGDREPMKTLKIKSLYSYITNEINSKLSHNYNIQISELCV